MKWALLFALLLRLLPCAVIQSSAAAPTEAPLLPNETDGPKCARWLYGTEPPQVEAFQCAEQPDDAEDKFCCGTCGQALSCSFQELAEGSAEGPIDGSAEGPIDGSAEGPIDGGSSLHGLRLTWFCIGVLFTAIFYWFTWGKGKKFCCRQTFPGHQGVELVVPASLRSRKLRESSKASTRSTPLSSVIAEGLPVPRGCSAATSSNASSARSQAGGARRNERRIWNPRVPDSLRMDPSPSQPKQRQQKTLGRYRKIQETAI